MEYLLENQYILDENGDKLTFKIKPKDNQKELVDIINRIIKNKKTEKYIMIFSVQLFL